MTKRTTLRGSMITFIIFVMGLSLWQVSRPWLRSTNSEGITLRFSHWQLEPGVRQAFEAIARDYEALHPNVRIEQIAIPGGTYTYWGRTQLIGGSAPDLMRIGQGISRGLFFKDFIPITTYVNQPNPYNRDNALADVLWRNTFNDGMESSFDVKTMECFGASLFSGNKRLCSNQGLLKEVAGSDTFPQNFAEFQKLRDRLRQYNQDHGTSLSLISGSRYYVLGLFQQLFSTQTQKLSSELNPLIDFPLSTEDFQLSYLSGQWSMHDEAIRQGAQLLREASSMISRGYTQAKDDQALLSFSQGEALLILITSMQVTGVQENSPFPIQIHNIPLPQTSHPVFGSQMRGPISEKPLKSNGAFGITRTSPNKEIALDFLRYITSQEVCRKFSKLSQNLPTIVGIKAPELMTVFFPDLRGFPQGSDLFASPEVGALFARQQYVLASPDSTADQFLASLEPHIRSAMRRDLKRILKSRETGIRLLESSIAASERLSQYHPDDTQLANKLRDQLDTQNEIEATAYYTSLRLQRSARKSP